MLFGFIMNFNFYFLKKLPFSIEFVLVYIPANGVQELLFLHALANMYCFPSFLDRAFDS